jgi:hypothetical protein
MRGAVAPLLEDTCSHETVARRGLLDPDLVAQARQRHSPRGSGHAYPSLWTLMILELWSRAVLDKYRQPAAKNYAVGV